MKKRTVTFIEGEYVTYDLPSNKASTILNIIERSSNYESISPNVYRVADMHILNFVYDLCTESLPPKGSKTVQYYFFTGEFAKLTMDEEELVAKLKKLETKFSYSKVADDVYRICEL